MTRIVTTHYRYKRPPRKRKPIEIEGPAVVRGKVSHDATLPAVVRKAKPGNDNRPETSTSAADPPRSAIVTARRRGKRFAEAPDLTPEEHQRRGEAAGALWRELVGEAAAKDEKSAAVSTRLSSPAIATTGRKRRSVEDRPHLPMELPLSRKPIERDGDDYKQMKAAMARRMRGE